MVEQHKYYKSLKNVSEATKVMSMLLLSFQSKISPRAPFWLNRLGFTFLFPKFFIKLPSMLF